MTFWNNECNEGIYYIVNDKVLKININLKRFFIIIINNNFDSRKNFQLFHYMNKNIKCFF